MKELLNFGRHEFVCPCCKVEKMDREFLQRLDVARLKAGVSFVITSGFRCEKYNFELKGAVKDSAHVRGFAVDIACADSYTRKLIIDALLSVGFNRIGIASTFIHADSDPKKTENVIWTY